MFIDHHLPIGCLSQAVSDAVVWADVIIKPDPRTAAATEYGSNGPIIK